MRVPIGVVDDDHVGRGEVDTEAACARRQKENEFLTVWHIEFVDLSLAVLVRGVPIEATVLERAPETVVLEYVKTTTHLTEEQHSRALLLHFGQQFVQKYHLPAIFHQVVICCVWWS